LWLYFTWLWLSLRLWLTQHAEVTAEVIMVDIKVTEDIIMDMVTVVDIITGITNRCFYSLVRFQNHL
jgi:hypothetical protein